MTSASLRTSQDGGETPSACALHDGCCCCCCCCATPAGGALLHARWWMALPSIVLRWLLPLLLGPAAARASAHTPVADVDPLPNPPPPTHTHHTPHTARHTHGCISPTRMPLLLSASAGVHAHQNHTETYTHPPRDPPHTNVHALCVRDLRQSC